MPVLRGQLPVEVEDRKVDKEVHLPVESECPDRLEMQRAPLRIEQREGRHPRRGIAARTAAIVSGAFESAVRIVAPRPSRRCSSADVHLESMSTTDVVGELRVGVRGDERRAEHELAGVRDPAGDVSRGRARTVLRPLVEPDQRLSVSQASMELMGRLFEPVVWIRRPAAEESCFTRERASRLPRSGRDYAPQMPFGPHDAGKDAIGRAQALLAASQNGALPGGVASDMRRLSVVLAIAALDAYMHRLITDRAFTHQKLPGKLAELEVRFDQLLVEADASYEAARKPPHNSRPRVRVKQALRNQLLRKTFQSFDDVLTALGMAGASGNWGVIGPRMGMTRKQIEARLNGIVVRRNQVVHEGDYERLDRPRTAKLNTLTGAQAAADIQFVADLIDAIDAAI